MLDLRPNCEYCDRDLPPHSPDARICTYECTFCVDCVERVLHNVCPNCGGGFERRPIRPARAHRQGVGLQNHPPSNKRVVTSRDKGEIAEFIAALRETPPAER